MRHARLTVIATALLLAGCSTTVAGTPVADPSAASKPETGSYSTEARTIGATSQEDGEALEGYRMAETVPYLYEVDPALRFNGKVRAGSRSSIGGIAKEIFGSVPGEALAGAEAGVTVGADDTKTGATSDAQRKSRGVVVGVYRMASAAAATSVVGPGLRGLDAPLFGQAPPPKVTTRIPGYDGAVAYTMTRQTSTATVALLAYKQFVIGVYGDLSGEQVKTYFDKQTKGLDGFTPTPLDKVTTLKLDPDGVAGMTVSPAKGNGGYSLPARVAVLRQTDVQRSVKTFADAGVDVVGSGGSTTYRAKDAQGAQHVVDEFLAENKAAFPKAQSESIKGVPGSTCLTYAAYEGAPSTDTWCIVAVGRFVAEVSADQRVQAAQAVGAAYVILKSRQ
ncbi:DUF7373 family lipoprotein [Tsukamurella pulmonis]|uniref:DUF7373 family lipoprotein n=1 Tax=Tsukamurella pulmonis TaxID=47312 RepID=UPI000AA23D10|nr:hypothetical protein [Tsukamurella pulmonis]